MEHHETILAKFVSIIGELVANSASSSLKETDWDNMGSSSCRFIEDVIKGVTTMHRVLYQHLPAAQVQVNRKSRTTCNDDTGLPDGPVLLLLLHPTASLYYRTSLAESLTFSAIDSRSTLKMSNHPQQLENRGMLCLFPR